MSVTFVLRSHYAGPSEKHVATFDDASVLDWFRSRWQDLAADDPRDRAEAILGTEVYGFGSLGEAIAEHAIAPPETMEALGAILDEHLYVEGEILCGEHALQVLTDDDELQLAYFFFDDSFDANAPGRSAFLSLAGWRLPATPAGARPTEQAPVLGGTELVKGDRAAGCVWIARLAYYDSGNLYDLEGPHVLVGHRVPDLARALASAEPDDDWPFELRLLRSQLLGHAPPEPAEAKLVAAIRSEPSDVETWAVYSDWLLERGAASAGCTILRRGLEAARGFPVASIMNGMSVRDRLRGSLEAAEVDAAALLEEAGGSGDPTRCLLALDEHVAQLCLFTDEWGSHALYHQWVFFDDVWAAAHGALAAAILAFASRWDVLSDPSSA